MKIKNVSNINFGSAKRVFVSKKTQESAIELLKRMNSGTTYKENKNGTSFVSDIFAGLSMNKKVRFSDIRYFLAPTENKVENKADCVLSIGKKQIHFNSESGEVFYYKIGIFSTLRGLLFDVERYVTLFLKNFDNPDVVTHSKFGVQGFTEKGLERFKKYI